MDDAKELDEGSVIGNYRVVRLLGQGGMGTVYEVEHIELGTHYALKTFTFDPANDVGEALKTKFLEEGKLLARLKHPNLTHVFDLGFEEKTQMPYFVMDLVVYADGGTYTAEDIELKDIDEDLVYDWFVQLASALDYIHGEGIVHRDIKPSNLLVDKDLHVVLTDFGISRIFGAKIKSEVDATKTMVAKTGRGKLVLGTEHYIAPEVAEGEEATPQADAYSLGVMLIRWLTGFYYGDNPGAIALLSRKKYRWLPVIARLVAPVGRRPENYTELVRLIKPNEPEKPTADKRPKKANRRKLAENVIAAALGLGIAALIAVGGYFGYRYFEKLNAERDRKLAEIQEQIKAKEAREAKEKAAAEAARKAKEAEEKRIAEEKRQREEAKLAERRRIEEARTKIEKQDAKDLKARELPNQSNAKPLPEKPKKEFIVEGATDDGPVQKDYGPIPDKKYAWLKNGVAAYPQEVKFLMMNGAEIDLLPQKAGVFYMTNDDQHGKARHKVTLTRPFWVSRYCVTAMQWREFDDGAVADCQSTEQAVGPKYPVSKKMTRQRFDKFCEYLTNRYRTQLPKGYVFRLPSEAEWEYALDWERNCMVIGNMWEQVHFPGSKSKETMLGLIARCGLKAEEWKTDGDYGYGWSKNHRVYIGGKARPLISGMYDPCNHECYLLDTFKDGGHVSYADEEVDPLRWSDIQNTYDRSNRTMIRGWERYRGYWGMDGSCIQHLVVGPDLVGEKAWNNERISYEVQPVRRVARNTYSWNPSKVKTKISKPQEIVFKLENGGNMIFCTVPKGKFNMSNPDGQDRQYHKVELTYPFWMTKYCITARQWREFGPNDCEGVCRALEEGFPKLPICPRWTRFKWMAYIDFLNKRYGHQLPKGYVFRLPTEAEYEWAFIADKDGDIRSMRDDLYDPWHGNFKSRFADMWKKAKLPAGLRCHEEGCILGWFVGGRTQASGFGVCDLRVDGDQWMIDTYDADIGRRPDGSVYEWNVSDATIYQRYDFAEKDPIRFAGKLARRFLRRNGMWRQLCQANWEGFAHLVVGPDLEAPHKKAEMEPFPANDFGGKFLGGSVQFDGVSSRHDEAWRNTSERFSQMVSQESLISRRYDKKEDTNGFHTQHEDSPWIQLKFTEVKRITGLQIDIYDREQRSLHLRVWTSLDGKHFTEVAKENEALRRYRFDVQSKNVRAKYIRIGREPGFAKDWFHLDKILIYGK